MRWLYKLENRIGRFHISNLMRYIIVGMAIVFVVNYAVPQLNLINYMVLDRTALFSGQVWRLITFIFVPPQTSMIWLFISLYFYYMIGNSLENAWGSFRFNVYYLLGIIGAIIACLVSPAGYADNSALNYSLFLAFATAAPDTQFLLFFIIPVKAKWLALVYVVFQAIAIIQGFFVSVPIGLSLLILMAFGLLNYFVFFGKGLIEIVREQIRIQKNRRNWRNR